MNNIILAYYTDNNITNRDSLGDYFVLCADDIKDFINRIHPNRKIIEMKDNQCNVAMCELKLNNCNSNDFIFISYCHGTENSFIDASGLSFIEKGKNDNYLKNGWVFTNSCYSAKQLGYSIITNGGKLFVGFEDKSWVVFQQKNIFIQCDNYPIKIFFENKFFIDDKNAILRLVKKEYTKHIDKLYKTDYFAASKLLHNRDCLKIV